PVCLCAPNSSPTRRSRTSTHGGSTVSRPSSRRSSSAAFSASPTPMGGPTTSPRPSSTQTPPGRPSEIPAPVSSATRASPTCCSRRVWSSSTPRSRRAASQSPTERRQAQRRHLLDGLEDDRPAHLRRTLGAVDEADRHLDYAKALADRAIRAFDLERVALRVNVVEGDRLEHVAPVALEASSQVAHAHAEQHPRVERAAPGDDAADEAPVLGAAARNVPRPERQIGALPAGVD